MATLLPSRSVVYTASTIKLTSTLVSLGQSTNQTYNNLSSGTYSNWINAASSLGLSAIKRVAMSSSGQYQLIVVGSSAALYLSTDSGVTWITQGAAGFLGTGLPVVSTAYTYGAISANGQYMLVCVNAGSIYVSSNYGASFTNASLPSVAATNWFAFENNTTDSTGSIVPTVTGTMYYVPGKVGTYALSLLNTPGATPANYLRGSWTAPANCSITGWVCPQSVAGAVQIIFSSNSSGILFFIENTNNFRAYIPSGGSQTLISTSVTPIANTWYHVAIIFQTGGTCSLYINGTLQGTVANTSGFSGWTGGTFSLGTYDVRTISAYSGYVDDLRLYNYAIVPSGAPPQNFNFAAMSGTGQYMTVTSPGNVAYSSNYGQTWTTPYGLTTAGQMSGLAVSNTGQYMVAQNGGVIVPQLTSLGANTWIVNGITWISSASSTLNSNFNPWVAFNNVANVSAQPYSWGSVGNYSSGTYNNTYSTTVQTLTPSTTIYGEWLQLQSSVPLVINAYSFSCGSFTQIPKNFYIVGSNDGTNWYPIQYAQGVTNPFTSNYTSAYTYLSVNSASTQYMYAQVAGSWTTTTYSYTTNAYTYFRLIAQSLWSPGTNCELEEWWINFSGGISYSTNYGSTWTNTTNTAILPTGPSAVSGNGQYTLTSMGPTGQTALVTTNYVASPYTSANGCILYYPLNDASGTTSVMEIMNGYNSTDKNVTFGSAGKVGTCVSCSGTYLAVPSAAFASWTTLSAGSIACWIKPSATALTGAASQVFSKYISGPSYYNSIVTIGLYYNGTSLVTGTAGKVYFGMSSTQYSSACSSNTVLLADTWYHIVITFNGSAVMFYINGVLDNTFNCNWTLTGTPTNMIVCSGVSYPFSGYMDEFSLWNVALSQNTITAL